MVLVDHFFLFVWNCCSLWFTGRDLSIGAWQFVVVVVVVSEVQEPRLEERDVRGTKATQDLSVHDSKLATDRRNWYVA